jgi:hypothetical protein
MLDKCMHALGDRPAIPIVAFALLVCALPLRAQTSVRTAAPLLGAPAGRELATVRPGAVVRAAATRQGHTQITLDGFIDGSLLGSGRDSFPTIVKAPSGARQRSAGRSDASIVADLRDGMGVTVISRSGDWVRVRRTGWIATSALAPGAPAGSTSPAQRSTAQQRPTPSGRGRGEPPRDTSTAESPAASAAPPPPPSTPPPPPGSLRTAPGTELRTSPNGRAVARLDSAATMTAVARDNGWTRVRIEGWIRDDNLVPTDSSYRPSLSAADIRAAPDGAKGAMVRWEIQFIAIQRADQLRPDLRLGEPYILARGPGDETGLLYFAVPQSLLPEIERLEPLQELTVTARVRVGRSEPVGVPILDLLSAVRR